MVLLNRIKSVCHLNLTLCINSDSNQRKSGYEARIKDLDKQIAALQEGLENQQLTGINMLYVQSWSQMWVYVCTCCIPACW